MAEPEVVFFTGPSGAGKTTVGEAWAAARSRPTGFFDHDHARFILRAGYVSRTARHDDPALAEEGDRQWLLAAAVCEGMAETYTSWGLDFAVAGFRPPGEWRGCWSRLDALDPLIVVLLPTTETLGERNAARGGRARVGEGSMQRSLQYPWDDWRTDPRALVMDNTHLSLEATVARVEEQLASRRAH